MSRPARKLRQAWKALCCGAALAAADVAQAQWGPILPPPAAPQRPPAVERAPVAHPLPRRDLRVARAPAVAPRGASALPSASRPTSPAAGPLASALPSAPLGELYERQAGELLERGSELAERGALFAARAEFIRALRLATLGGDDAARVRRSEALAAGLLALDEADDFRPRGTLLDADLDVDSLARSHRTPTIREDCPTSLLPDQAIERYDRYAVEQLTIAGDRRPVASRALHSLSKLYAIAAEQPQSSLVAPREKGIALGRAAIAVDPDNFLAVNDLAVMYSTVGRREEGVRILAASARRARHPALWENLALLHARLGQPELAAAAHGEAMRLLATGMISTQYAGHPVGTGPTIEWVEPSVFAGAPSPAPPATPEQPTTARRPRTGAWR